MPSKKYKVSSQLVEIDPRAVEVPSWARKIAREYLEESIKYRGVVSPIVVGRLKEGSRTRFILIDGAGRLSLAIEKGLDLIPARIFDIRYEEEALLLSIELELTKEPWSLEYMYQVIKELIARGYKKTEIAKMLNVPRSKIYRILKLDEVEEEVKQKVLEGEIPLRALDSEEQLQKYLHPGEEEEEEREEKYIPASEIQVPEEEPTEEEIEEIEVYEEEKEEEGVKRIPAEKVMLYHALKDAVNALNDAINDLQAASEYIHSDPEKSAAIFEYMRKIAEIRDLVENFRRKAGEELK